MLKYFLEEKKTASSEGAAEQWQSSEGKGRVGEFAAFGCGEFASFGRWRIC
ncbi:MAG: hypothetical protein VB076_09575 [Synergistaceae bacterium]|nr:hypothetical protein [Synergistaceae bacterium]